MNPIPSSQRILLVEDDASLAEMVADFLAPHGFHVSVVGRGDTAPQRIIEENPDRGAAGYQPARLGRIWSLSSRGTRRSIAVRSSC